MQHTIHSFPRSLVMVKVCLLVLGWCADGNNRQILYVGNNRWAQTLAHTRTRFLYVKSSFSRSHSRFFPDYFSVRKWLGDFFLVSIIRFFAVIQGRHGDGVRRPCVCVSSAHPCECVWWWGRKSSNFPAICQLFCLRGKRFHVPACFENLDLAFSSWRIDNYCFWNGLLEPCKGERNSRFQSPIKVGPPKWEHREKPHGDVYSSQGLLRWHFSFLNLAFSVCCFSFFF